MAVRIVIENIKISYCDCGMNFPPSYVESLSVYFYIYNEFLTDNIYLGLHFFTCTLKNNLNVSLRLKNRICFWNYMEVSLVKYILIKSKYLLI
jgi:hypothetical protein